jgi:hypothetical protein
VLFSFERHSLLVSENDTTTSCSSPRYRFPDLDRLDYDIICKNYILSKALAVFFELRFESLYFWRKLRGYCQVGIVMGIVQVILVINRTTTTPVVGLKPTIDPFDSKGAGGRTVYLSGRRITTAAPSGAASVIVRLSPSHFSLLGGFLSLSVNPVYSSFIYEISTSNSDSIASRKSITACGTLFSDAICNGVFPWCVTARIPSGYFSTGS